MASKPFKKRCKRPGCPNLHSNKNGYCDSHQIKRDYTKEDNERLSAFERGYDYRWQKFSERFLKRNPICARCGDKATITDHKIPIQIMIDIYGRNELKDELYQPLCVRCNTLKAKEDQEQIKEYFDKKKEIQDKLGNS